MKAILTHYVGPTNTRGGRIVATDDDGNRVTIEYEHIHSAERNHSAAAMKLCQKMGWTGTFVYGSTRRGMVFVFADDDASNEVYV